MDEFLVAYAEFVGWTETDPQKIKQKLCEEQVYSPDHGREFLMIAFGWQWRATDYTSANCEVGVLTLELNEIYKEVAKKNNWPN